MTSRSAPQEPPREDDALPSGAPGPSDGSGQPARPEPLKDEIAKDARRSSPGSGARFEVRLRRLVLLLVILIPIIWWIVVSLA